MENAIIFQEEYLGKPREFTKLEIVIQSILDDINANVPITKSAASVKEAERILTKVIGCKAIYLNFYEINDYTHTPNIYTLVSSYRFIKPQSQKGDVLTTRGDVIVNVNLSTLIIKKYQLTKEELVAIILHEIGHNLDMSTFAAVEYSLLIYNFVFSIISFMSGNFGAVMNVINSILSLSDTALTSVATFNKTVDDLLTKIPFFRILNKVYWGLIAEISSITKYTPLPHLFALKSIIFNIFNPYWYTGYGREKFADSFAAMYGYAPHLATGLNKFYLEGDSNIDKGISAIPIVGPIAYDFAALNIQIIGTIIGVHPHTPRRIRAMMDKLKKDLEDPKMDKRMKKDLEEHVKLYQKVIDTKILEPEKERERKMIRVIFMRSVLESNSNIHDIRDLFGDPEV